MYTIRSFLSISNSQVVSHTDHSQGLLTSVLKVLLHALGTNQSTFFIRHLFAVQRSFVFKVRINVWAEIVLGKSTSLNSPFYENFFIVVSISSVRRGIRALCRSLSEAFKALFIFYLCSQITIFCFSISTYETKF